MTEPVSTPVLPSSRKALEQLARAQDWNVERLDLQARSVRIAWRITAAAVVFGLLGMGIGVAQSLRPLTPPVPIVVDKTTGEATVVPQLSLEAIPPLQAVDQHWSAVYVRSRETYHFNFLRRDYEQVARMSTTEVFSPYGNRFTGPEALQSKVGSTEEHRITIVSARPSATSQAGRRGEMIVTFDRELRYAQGRSPSVTRHVATVIYEYRPASMKAYVDRLENPFGFVVTSYRVESELLKPTPAGGLS